MGYTYTALPSKDSAISRGFMALQRPTNNIKDVFTTYTYRDERGCLIWTGAKDAGGYARVSHKRRNWKAARLLWELEVGPIPEGLTVQHWCHNTACVEISHLALMTRADNTSEMWRFKKGRTIMQRAKANLKTRGTQAQQAMIRTFGLRERLAPVMDDPSIPDETVILETPNPLFRLGRPKARWIYHD